MSNIPKAKPGPEDVERSDRSREPESETETERVGDDDEARRYYYDDAHGYKDYDPDSDDDLDD